MATRADYHTIRTHRLHIRPPAVPGPTGAVYVGVSSNEELVDGIGLECCTFRGSVVKLDLKTGAKQWQFHTAPDNGGKVDGWSGNAVW